MLAKAGSLLKTTLLGWAYLPPDTKPARGLAGYRPELNNAKRTSEMRQAQAEEHWKADVRHWLARSPSGGCVLFLSSMPIVAGRRTNVEAAQKKLAGHDKETLVQREAPEHEPELHEQRRVKHEAHRNKCTPVKPARLITVIRNA